MACYNLLGSLICAMILADGASAMGNVECRYGFTRFKSNCYAFIKHQTASWIEAQSYCASLGGFLAEIKTSAQNDFVKNLALKNVQKRYQNKGIWLGGNDILTEGRWVWAYSGAPVDYSDWHSNHPGGNANCMNMKGKQKAWTAAPCQKQYRFICQTGETIECDHTDLEGRCRNDSQCDEGGVCLGARVGILGTCMDDPEHARCDTHVDVAIVGAGPGGAYAAYKLRHQGKRVGLFEYSDQVGGRCFNYVLDNAPDVNLEVGAMRYIADVMPKLEGLVAELGLTSSVFKEGFGHTQRSRYFLRGQNMPAQQFKTGIVPYNLTAEEKAHQSDLIGLYLKKLTGSVKGEFSRDDLRKLRLLQDGRLLGELSYEEFLDMAASSEAKAMLNDAKKFQGEIKEPTNILIVLHDDYGSDFFGGDVMKIDDVDGMQAVPREMVDSFLRENPEKNTLSKNSKLVGIRHRQSDKRSLLYFQRTVTVDGATRHAANDDNDDDGVADNAFLMTVCARQVILAVPKFALMQLDWPPVQTEWAENVYSGHVNPASKIYLTFESAWWLNSSFTEFPSPVTFGGGPTTHQIYDWMKSNTTGDDILLVYSDGDNVRVQKDLQDQGPAMPGSAPGAQRVSVALKDAMLDDFARVFNVCRSAMPEPKSGVAQFWTEYPFGGGWVLPLPGYDLGDLADAMQRPSLTQEVYVAGTDYSWGANLGWSEGAYETMQEVLDTYFTVV